MTKENRIAYLELKLKAISKTPERDYLPNIARQYAKSKNRDSPNIELFRNSEQGFIAGYYFKLNRIKK